MILWSLLLGLLVNVSGAPVYSSEDAEKPATEASEGTDKAEKPAEESKGEDKSEGEKKPAAEESKEDSKADKAEKPAAEADKKADAVDKPKAKEKPKKEKLEKPEKIKVSNECWDAMVEAKGDESGKDCKKALSPLRRKKTEDGEKAPCAGKENKKGFKAAIKELCKKEKDD